jgi:6-pyruvoyl-tetrahydropterin synthase
MTLYLIQKFAIDCGHHIEDREELITKKCARPHGHTYNLEFKIKYMALQKSLKREFIDFAIIKRKIKKVLDQYDHQEITDQFGIDTVESFIQVILSDVMVEFNLNNNDLSLRIMETANSGVELVSN